MKKYLFIPAAICLAAMLSCRQNHHSQVNYSGFTQGTTFHIKFYSGGDSTEIKQGIDSILNLINHTASLYDSTSEICLWNNNRPVKPGFHFHELFRRSLEISQKTGGAFDITVGPLVKAWGFHRKMNVNPEDALIDSLMQHVGYKLVHLNIANNDTLAVKDHPAVQIDFNAIAQGYTVDIIAEFLEKKGYKNYIVEVGGEVRASGTKTDGQPWIVGIERPAADSLSPQELQEKVRLENRSMATSGNYRKFFIRDGVKYAHTIDPASGRPVSHTLLSVTVVASDCATADAWATAFMVLGSEKSMELLKKNPGMEAFFISSGADGKFVITSTPGFNSLLIK